MLSRLQRARRPRLSIVVVGAALSLVVAGAAIGASVQSIHIFTPKTADQVTNIDILRSEIKNYYGTPTASTGTGATAGWTLDLNLDSNYAMEAESVALDGWHYMAAMANSQKPTDKQLAVVFDVDDTTLTTWNYELFSNWAYNPANNAIFVGLTGATFTGNLFPATPGMYDLLWAAHDAGYAIFFITGRHDDQHLATIANLVNDVTAGYTDITTVDHNQTGLSTDMPEIDVEYPMPYALDTGHGAAYNGGSNFADGLFTKPDSNDYPDYLTDGGFCTLGSSCSTIAYKSGTRAYIESQGFDIVASFGDQYSDLLGGYADKTFKMPNPNYYLP